LKGFQGICGFQGYTGFQGYIGFQGFQGFQGSRSIIKCIDIDYFGKTSPNSSSKDYLAGDFVGQLCLSLNESDIFRYVGFNKIHEWINIEESAKSFLFMDIDNNNIYYVVENQYRPAISILLQDQCNLQPGDKILDSKTSILEIIKD